MRFSLKSKEKGPASCMPELFRRQYKDTIQIRDIVPKKMDPICWTLMTFRGGQLDTFLCAVH